MTVRRAPPRRRGTDVDAVRSAVERMSGVPLDDVDVQLGSHRPASVGAVAYTLGRSIHVSEGHESSLGHELWHAVQQKQGRVDPTGRVGGHHLNADPALEREADEMGERAHGEAAGRGRASVTAGTPGRAAFATAAAPIVQRTVQSGVGSYDEKGKPVYHYFSTHDLPSMGGKSFKTPDEAWKHDSKKAAKKGYSFKPDDRVPTPYSYYSAKDTQAVGSAFWGPHTLSHSSTAFRLNQQIGKRGRQELLDEQVPSLKEFDESLMAERPGWMAKKKPWATERYQEDFRIQRERAEMLAKGGKSTQSEFHEALMRAMQMDPYTTYGKPTQGKAPSKRAAKYKNEQADDEFYAAFDPGGTFNDSDGFEAFKQRRMKLWPKEELGTPPEPRSKIRKEPDVDPKASEEDKSIKKRRTKGKQPAKEEESSEEEKIEEDLFE